MVIFSAKNDKIRGSEDRVRPFTVLLLIALSVALCAAICLTLWSAEKNNPLPKRYFAQSVEAE
jgi:hypothetical protein